MKKILLTITLATAVLAACKAQLPENLQNIVDSRQEEYASKASEEMKNAFSQQLEEFIKSSDLSDSLGISAENQEKIEKSLQDYVNQYELSEEELNQAQDALQDLIEQAQKLDTQTIEDRLQDILQQ